VSSFGRLVLLLVAVVAVQQPAISGQVVPPKLATVLGDLARAVPQDARGLSWEQVVGKPLVMASLPRSVQDAAASRRLRLDAKNYVQVYILLSEVNAENLRRLVAAGVKLEITDAAGRRVQARVPVRSLERLASFSFVTFVRLPSYAIRHTGAVVSEGDAIHGASAARPQFGVDGTGVRVGVISDGIKGVVATKCDSCDPVSGGPVASGDLPETSGTRRDGLLTATSGGVESQSFRADEDLEDTHSFFEPCAFRGAGAEGTALLEVVHDLAPGAQLSFGNANTSLEFIAAVNGLAADNDVVVDDLGFIGEPADGQSSVSRNTAAALNNPANRIRTYVTSVGNAANDHYFGAYVDSGQDAGSINGVTSGGRMHLFRSNADTTDVLGLGPQPYDLISLPTNGEVIIVLTWNDPAGQSGNNYDLYLVDDSTGQVVARSTDVQRGIQDPIEAIDFLNRGQSGDFRIVVQNVNSQAAPRNLNMFAFQPQCAVDGPRRLASGRHERHNYNTPSRSVLAQSDSGGSPVSAISVGAICSASAAAQGVFAGSDAPSESCNDGTHGTIEFFSSLGPTLDNRLKPDIAAIDGVSITGAGRFPSPFFGTSAAAPHVAGIAALVLQAAPCLRSGGAGAIDAESARTTLRDLLVSTADPIGSPIPNQTFGYGRANAFRAVESARTACGASPEPPEPPPPPQPPQPPSSNVIALNSATRFQTINGWGTFVNHTLSDLGPFTDAQLGQMFDVEVNDLGLNAIQFAVRSGTEGNGDSFAVVNDNNDPNVLNPAGFTWTNIDTRMKRVLIPFRQRVLAAGLPFYWLLEYVDFGGPASPGHNTQPAEYAEFMVAVWQHMRSTFGFVPNGINIINEPDGLGGKWNPTELGNAIAAVAQRFQKEGIAMPNIIAPSTTQMQGAVPYTDGIIAVSGARQHLTEIGYHRYSMNGSLADLGNKTVQLGLRGSAMTEFWGLPIGGYNADTWFEDLTAGRASTIYAGAVSGFGTCDWSVTVMMPKGGGPVTVCPNMKLVGHYTKYVRPGAQRIGASGGSGLSPVAFVNPNGGYVVVVRAQAAGSFSVTGLPAGRYGISYATESDSSVSLGDISIGAGQPLTTQIPSTGVITIFGR
jgi:O-glycosyl hydrolase